MNKKGYKGRIVGNNAMDIRFRSFYNEDLYLGDVLVAQDQERGALFLLRVVDIDYGVETNDPEWSTRTAGNMMLLDASRQSFSVHNKEKRLFKVGKCVPLGYISGGKFLKPKTLPAHFSQVRSPLPEDFEFLKEYLGGIQIGNLRSGEDVLDFPIAIKREVLPSHVGVFATTGMGKSNLVKVMAASVIRDHKCGMLIFDPHGEYYDGGGEKGRKGLKHCPGAEEGLKVYSARKLSGPHEALKIGADTITLSDLTPLFSFSPAQLEAAITLEGRHRKNWLRVLAETDVPELTAASGGNFHEATLGVLQRRARTILGLKSVTGNENSTVCSITNDVRQGKVVLVDVSHVSGLEELLVSGVIARKLFNLNKRDYQTDNGEKQLPCLVALEEAQRVLGKGEHRGVFAQIAREGRKFKTGLCAISQQPKLIDEELLSQFNTLFILGLADEKDRAILRNSAKQDISKLGNEIQTLMQGEILITSPGVPFALPAKIFLYEEHLKTFKAKPKENVDPDFYG